MSNHPASLGVCRAYANTLKHMKRDSAAETVARIAIIETGPNGQKMTIAHGPGNQPPASYTRTDALDLAGQSEQAWRDLLTLHGIPMPA